MYRFRLPLDFSFHSLIALVLLAALPGVSSAQADEIPKNATANSYSNGWTCDRGYHEIDGACGNIVLPVNAYATNRAYGRGWECGHGY
jgi:hypothetical protein